MNTKYLNAFSLISQAETFTIKCMIQSVFSILVETFNFLLLLENYIHVHVHDPSCFPCRLIFLCLALVGQKWTEKGNWSRSTYSDITNRYCIDRCIIILILHLCNTCKCVYMYVSLLHPWGRTIITQLMCFVLIHTVCFYKLTFLLFNCLQCH